MKKLHLIFAALMILGTTLNAQWVELVTPTINYEIKSSSFIDLEISLEGEPYLLYNVEVPTEGEKDSKWKLFVQKYNPSNEEWGLVGGTFVNELSASDNHLAMDSEDNIYVAYLKLGIYGEGSWCTVNKFDGANWVQIGDWNAGIVMSDVTMYCDNNDDVYVSYFDVDTYSGPVVKRYLGTGSGWETLGEEPFLPSGQCLGPALTTDNDGNVLVSFGDGYAGLFFSVKKFNGTNWEYIGSPGFWDEPNYPTSIIVGHNDVVHATTTDFWSLTSTVLNRENNTWNDQFICYDAGNMPFTKSNDEVYMGYAVSDNGYRVRVKKVDDSGNWVDLPDQPGQYCITPGWPRTYFDIEADNYGNLYLAYLKGDHWNHHVSVLKLDIATGVSVAEKENYTIYPNPTNGILNLTGFQNLLGFEISDITGKIVYTRGHVPSGIPLQIDLSGLKKGVYIANITTSQNSYIEKLIIR